MQHGFDWQGECLDGWLASEKFDGVRAYWDGVALWTRSGRQIQGPAWFMDALPKGQALDGEIWGGRGQLQAAKNATNYGKWSLAVRFMAFDAPGASGSWAARMATIQGNQIVRPVPFHAVADSSALRAMFDAIKARGGEGLMVRHPQLIYESGRDAGLLKIKHTEQFRLSV